LLAIKGGSIGKNLNDVFSFTAYTSVIILLYKLGERHAKQLNKFIFWIGGFSFTLYLFHMLIWDAAKINNIYYVPLILCITLVICYYYELAFNVISNKQRSKTQKTEEKLQKYTL
jgi:peptidoglycan/LPS O-acetylase OafA/YrhL